MPSFPIHCTKCTATIKSRSALRRHYVNKHPRSMVNVENLQFTGDDGEAVCDLQLPIINKRTLTYKRYLGWLAAVADRVNNVQHLRFPGKLFFLCKKYSCCKPCLSPCSFTVFSDKHLPSSSPHSPVA